MAIILKEITKEFGDHLVVNRVSLSVEQGELFVLLGASGSGKSTILRIIAGLTAPDWGNVELHGRDVTALPPQQRGVGFVFQNYAVFRHMTVAENVEFGLRIRGIARAECERRREELLDLVGLGGLGNRLSGQLSGGQRQRVALARALAYEPAVLLLDEPFGALDVKIRGQLRRSLKEIQRQLKVTTILVTHDQEEAFELADRIGVLERGRLMEVGTPEELYHRPRTEFVAAFVGGGNVLVGRMEKGRIRLGANLLPFPPDAPAHDEGAPVRILFRPETVLAQKEPLRAGGGVVTIGQGRLKECTFSGSTERLRFELETLQGVRPLAPALSYGQRFADIEMSRPSHGGVPALKAGDLYWIGLSRFHVLQPSGVKLLMCIGDGSAREAVLSMGAAIAAASHGPLTMLKVAASAECLDEARKCLQEICSSGVWARELHPELKTRQGVALREIVREVQEGYYDLVLLGRSMNVSDEDYSLGAIARRLLLSPGVPVLLAAEPIASIRRMLVCTAAGEPGKSDVRLAARLARHTKSLTVVLHVLPDRASVEYRKRVERHLEQARAVMEALNVKSEAKLAQGLLREAILQEAEEGDYDLIVMGAPAASALTNLYSFDLATQVAAGTRRAVLIVPAGE